MPRAQSVVSRGEYKTVNLFRPRTHPLNVTLAGIDELDLFPTREAREKALGEIGGSVKWYWLVIGVVITASAGVGGMLLGRYVMHVLAPRFLPWAIPPLARELAMFAFVAAAVFLALRILHRWGVKGDLRAKLIALGVPVCRNCGYLLRGLDPSTLACPECGREIEQSIRTILSGENKENGADRGGTPRLAGRDRSPPAME